MTLLKWAFMMLLLASSSVMAETSIEQKSLDIEKVKSLVKEFELEKQKQDFKRYLTLVLGGQLRTLDVDHCEPDGDLPPRTSCMESVCERLNSWDCDSQSELNQVADMCRGNHNGRCISAMCDKMNSWDCDSLSELSDVAQSCRGVRGSCVDFVCSKVSSWDCDSLSELRHVGQICQGARESCLEFTCSRLNSWDCDSLSELEQIAEQCRSTSH